MQAAVECSSASTGLGPSQIMWLALAVSCSPRAATIHEVQPDLRDAVHAVWLYGPTYSAKLSTGAASSWPAFQSDLSTRSGSRCTTLDDTRYTGYDEGGRYCEAASTALDDKAHLLVHSGRLGVVVDAGGLTAQASSGTRNVFPKLGVLGDAMTAREAYDALPASATSITLDVTCDAETTSYARLFSSSSLLFPSSSLLFPSSSPPSPPPPPSPHLLSSYLASKVCTRHERRQLRAGRARTPGSRGHAAIADGARVPKPHLGRGVRPVRVVCVVRTPRVSNAPSPVAQWPEDKRRAHITVLAACVGSHIATHIATHTSPHTHQRVGSNRLPRLGPRPLPAHDLASARLGCLCAEPSSQMLTSLPHKAAGGSQTQTHKLAGGSLTLAHTTATRITAGPAILVQAPTTRAASASCRALGARPSRSYSRALAD